MTKPKRILTMIALTILGIGLTFLFSWIIDVGIDKKYVYIQFNIIMCWVATIVSIPVGWIWATDGRD